MYMVSSTAAFINLYISCEQMCGLSLSTNYTPVAASSSF